MSRFRILARQTWTIARRDFIATVFTPTFLLFLFAPLLMGSLSAIGGLSARAASQSSATKARVLVIVDPARNRDVARIDARLRKLYRDTDEAPPPLYTAVPKADPAAQARAALDDKGFDLAAVLYGPLAAPHILYTARSIRSGDYLGELAERLLQSDGAGPRALSVPTKTKVERTRPPLGRAGASGFFAVFTLFFLTLLLAGQVVSGVAEEKGNKVIEILAAAVPLESVFFGKLLGAFGVAVLFLAFWGTLISQVGTLMPANLASGLASLTPAIGLPAFALLFFAYFTMAYMLLGAVFLGIGAQASSVREIQLLSLPITILQVSMFGLAAFALSQPNGWIATVATFFPLSSPFYMAGRAAQASNVWEHVAALAWQALWVTVFIAIGVRAFRRGVLQSGSGKIGWKGFGRRQSTVDMSVS